MDDLELKTTIDSLIALGNQLRAASVLEERAAPAPGAPASERARVRTAIPDMPSSLLRVLSIYDGIDNLEWVDISLMSCDELATSRDLDESWVDAGKAHEGKLIIVGQSASDSCDIAFLRSTLRDDGEMDIVNFDSRGELWRYPDLETCFRERVVWFEQSLASMAGPRTRDEWP